MSNVETVQQGYEAFGRGDIQGVLEPLAEDVRWEHHPTGNTAQDQDVPYMRFRSGREATAGFFQDIDENFEMHSFNPHSFLEGDGLVAAVIEYELTVKATGKQVHDGDEDSLSRPSRASCDGLPGFGHLEEAGRPDLMLENIVLAADKPYHRFFSGKTVETARERMAKFEKT